ncbi:hypothetical protein IEQ34_013081 [Dendrobium chrysotoxum]|uniref:Uncharacterized protein n=1 Tax=Dendrobium chrysotoxum TaxID=161865 RepID=A0AAV7GMH8_DENCH|nr:hypothetical protein IEQ34_013081 [Dendrobium chrysotoxum]
MSPNSKSCTVSNSTANRWLDGLPMFLVLRRPRYWLERASGMELELAIAKAMPWPPSLAYSEIMAKAKVVEKEKREPSVEFLKRMGTG